MGKKRKHSSNTKYKKRTITYNLSSTQKSVLVLALFWRYGYWVLMILMCLLLGRYIDSGILFSLFSIGYGVYSLVISKKEAKHFMVGMLDVEHRSIKNVNYNYCKSQMKEWKHEIKWVSIFFIFLGAILLVASVLSIIE